MLTARPTELVPELTVSFLPGPVISLLPDGRARPGLHGSGKFSSQWHGNRWTAAATQTRTRMRAIAERRKITCGMTPPRLNDYRLDRMLMESISAALSLIS